MNRLLRNASAAVLTTSLAFTLASCSSSDDETQVLRLAHVFGTESTQQGAILEFERLVEERTDGKLDIRIYPAGQLGGDEAIGRDLRSGAIDMALINPGSLGGVNPLLDFHYLPYIVTSFDQADKIFYGDGIIPTTLDEALADYGMESLANLELEFRSVTNNVHPVETVEDLSGLKLRVPGSAAIRGFFDAAHAQTLVMPVDELVTGLEQGTVDGQDNGVLYSSDTGLLGNQTYFTATNHVYAIASMVMSEVATSNLSDEDKDILRAAAEEVASAQIEENRERVDAYTEEIADEGIEVVQLSDEEQANFQAFGRNLWDNYASRYGEERIQKLRDEIDALEEDQ